MGCVVKGNIEGEGRVRNHVREHWQSRWDTGIIKFTRKQPDPWPKRQLLRSYLVSALPSISIYTSFKTSNCISITMPFTSVFGYIACTLQWREKLKRQTEEEGGTYRKRAHNRKVRWGKMDWGRMVQQRVDSRDQEVIEHKQHSNRDTNASLLLKYECECESLIKF